MNDNTFWALITATLTTGFLTFLVCLIVYFDNANSIQLKMVEQGASPLEASCAINDTYGNHPVCVALAADKVN